jgi:hypothetical protein
MGGLMHTIADGWRLRAGTVLQTSGKLWVGVTPESLPNYQVAGRGSVRVMSERDTLELGSELP